MTKERNLGESLEQDEVDSLALPGHVAGSGTLDPLVVTARDCGQVAAHSLRRLQN